LIQIGTLAHCTSSLRDTVLFIFHGSNASNPSTVFALESRSKPRLDRSPAPDTHRRTNPPVGPVSSSLNPQTNKDRSLRQPALYVIELNNMSPDMMLSGVGNAPELN